MLYGHRAATKESGSDCLGGCHLKDVEAAGHLRFPESGYAHTGSISTQSWYATLWGIVLCSPPGAQCICSCHGLAPCVHTFGPQQAEKRARFGADQSRSSHERVRQCCGAIKSETCAKHDAEAAMSRSVESVVASHHDRPCSAPIWPELDSLPI